MSYDVIVLGLGGMGSAAADFAAQRGARVLGFDRYDPPHTMASTHGRSRIIRLAYMEHPAYVPLLRRAYELWHDLEAQTGREVMRITGGLMIGREDSEAVDGSLRSAREHDIPHRMMSAAEARNEYPPFAIPDDFLALLDGSAGVLSPEECIRAYLARARHAGAELRTHTVVDEVEIESERVRVRVGGEVHEASQLIVTAGAWTGSLLPDLAAHLTPTREVMHWFNPTSGIEQYQPEVFPIFFWEPPDGDQIYGFPALDGPDGGVKVAIQHGGGPIDPNSPDRDVRDDDIARVRASIQDAMPTLNGEWLEGAVCIYTNTPDHHFLLGTHPGASRVHIAGGLSGHGFKFASVVGEVLADLALQGGTSLALDPFAIGRFG
ncbi:MAG: N-methyl-L-tryptophan oxidase [Acidobacteria bacterium]|nr:N-methyl-L-tryptophan oxidase [Acidobacteriota bacterium]